MTENERLSPDGQEATNKNEISLQEYYSTTESRLGYRIFLGGARHFGYYDESTSSAFPIDIALRAMEQTIFEALGKPKNANLFDAGCGEGQVALYLAKAGYNKIEGVDLVPRHLLRANKIIKKAGMERQVSVRLGDYHDSKCRDGSFEGLYTIESLVHSTQPLRALKAFFRLLKPGGRICINAYDREPFSKDPDFLKQSVRLLSVHAAMPEISSFEKGTLVAMLEEVGFEDVRLRDMSANILPMLRMFHRLGRIPYAVFRILGPSVAAGVERRLGKHFANTAAGTEAYKHRHLWRYVQVTGGKPEELAQAKF